MTVDLHETLQELGIYEFIDEADKNALARSLSVGDATEYQLTGSKRLPRYGFLFETKGLDAVRAAHRDGNGDVHASKSAFRLAFASWRALCSSGQTGMAESLPSMEAVDQLVEELQDGLLPGHLIIAFRLAVAGLMSEQPAATRHYLSRFDLSAAGASQDWATRVSTETLRAFCLLTRKDGGWRDIDDGLAAIDRLRGLQGDFEEQHLNNGGAAPTVAAIELVGLYHAAHLVTIAGDYLKDGGAPSGVRDELDRHSKLALQALESVDRVILAHLTRLLWVGCRALVTNSIWTHISALSESARRFARVLTDRGRLNPVLELWPGQQKALSANLLDPYRRAVLVEMPTSGGKTLLAKFSIVQNHALNPDSVVAYIVPTRALVNQVTADLRADLGDLGMRVEQSVPAFELDPLESQMLSEPPDVLVTTPEKLDLLIRREHPATAELSLVVADEAHNLRDRGRGSRLELLLGMLKRDRPTARFLLLSPFLPNDEELVTWLGEDQALPPISVDWKPGWKVVGTLDAEGRGESRRLDLKTVPAADNVDLPPGLSITVGERPQGRAIKHLTSAAVRTLSERGSVLVLCRGPGTSMTRAAELAESFEAVPHSQLLQAVTRYVDAEIGEGSLLSQCLRRGVAFHHSGLPHEVRLFVESLIAKGDISVVCGTTTLAQGVNFPIATVILETLRKGDVSLTYSDFWNIAGRAGRALMDTVGLVGYPTGSKGRDAEFRQFLSGEAEVISSQLAELIDQADHIQDQFDLNALHQFQQLSPLLQFLAHAMRVAGGRDVADEVESLLRASLVYHQARREGEERSERLVRLCRAYLAQLEARPAVLALADRTGFATPSVGRLMGIVGEDPGLRDRAQWRPDHLFGDDLGPLTSRIAAVGSIPEIRLSEGQGRPFNAERVAAIVRDWVRGDNLRSMAAKYVSQEEGDVDRTVSKFSKYLFSTVLGQASWGLGALETVGVGETDDASDDAGYVPAMVFFGVNTREGVWLRSAGVPRLLADRLADRWSAEHGNPPDTYDQLRKWVTDLDDGSLESCLPERGELTPGDVRLLWNQLAG